MIHDRLDERMKAYEATAQTKLVRRMPVAIRIDGKAFHTFTKGLHRPFDGILRAAMNNTMLILAKNIQNCCFAYCQSDEITLILKDWDTLETDAWFDNKVQKLTSISASMATLYFNQEFRRLAEDEIFTWKNSLVPQSVEIQERVNKYHQTLRNCIQKGAMFDARCFNIPREEVTNLIYWRQIDAIRNSVQACGQSMFSHKELMNKSTNDIKAMLFDKGYNWDTLPSEAQHGNCCYKTEDGWFIDSHMPVLKGEGRALLDNIIA